MPSDEGHAIADQLASQRHGLIGIAEVVADDQLDALAEDSAVGVKIFNGEFGAALILLSEPGISAGHRTAHANPDLGVRSPRTECRS